MRSRHVASVTGCCLEIVLGCCGGYPAERWLARWEAVSYVLFLGIGKLVWDLCVNKIVLISMGGTLCPLFRSGAGH